MKLQELIIKEELTPLEKRAHEMGKWLHDRLENKSMVSYLYHDLEKDELFWGEDTLNLNFKETSEFPDQLHYRAENGRIIIKGPLSSCKNFPRGFRYVALGLCTFKKLDIPLHDDQMNVSITNCKNLEDISVLKHAKLDELRIIDNNKLQVKDLPLWIRSLTIQSPGITSLKGIHEEGRKIGSITVGHHVKSNILGLLMMDVHFGQNFVTNIGGDWNPDLVKALGIMEKYRGEGKKGVLAAQEKLIDAGLDDYAEL